MRPDINGVFQGHVRNHSCHLLLKILLPLHLQDLQGPSLRKTVNIDQVVITVPEE